MSMGLESRPIAPGCTGSTFDQAQEAQMTASSTENNGTGSDSGTQSEDQASQGPDQASQGTQGQADDSPEGFDALPEETKTEIRQLRRENARLRTAFKATKAPEPAPDKPEDVLAMIAKALGVEAPKKTTQSAGQDDSATQVREAKVELAVYKVASKAGANPDAVLEQRSLMRDMMALDPSDRDFEKDVLAAVQEAVQEHTYLKATGTITKTPKSGGDLAGGKTGSTEKVYHSPQQRLADAYAAGGS